MRVLYIDCIYVEHVCMLDIYKCWTWNRDPGQDGSRTRWNQDNKDPGQYGSRTIGNQDNRDLGQGQQGSRTIGIQDNMDFR